MKQYDKIFIPDSKGTWEATGMDLESESIESKYKVIVCSIEELREMWAMAKSGPDYPGVFELFLKSKGVQL